MDGRRLMAHGFVPPVYPARRPAGELLGVQGLDGLPGDPSVHEGPSHGLHPGAHPQSPGPQRVPAQRAAGLHRPRNTRPLFFVVCFWYI